MISVIIATYNGETVLPKTLQALSLLEVPSQGVEFIIVDNASIDNTVNILSKYADKLEFKILHEAKQGKSHAIHKGLEHATGDLIVFSDDDVLPDKNWLIAYINAAAEQLDYSVFLGQIRPYWLAPAKDWLIKLANEGRVCGCTSKALAEGEASIYWAKGANFCIRKNVLNQVSFRNDLWVAGKNEVGGEDTDFVKKASEKGFQLWFVPEALLQHIIRPHEMTMLGIWKRYFRIGRSIAAITPQEKFDGVKILGYPRWFLLKVFKQCLSLIINAVKLNSYCFASQLIETAISCGQEYHYKHSGL
ncbi:glycosyltransferase family 2 protein [Colwellia sp. MB3u-4]|uniref:glycosyltransferase n=1 Tax=Colwellia sp. MB3u-4 TaxID=2759822 RepID=UPI0015F5CBCE|nr:glycosyltransferase family 2 protein [Colwellia sp. MB3u-4]MBA6290427.1 glycosyltransferase family 2 protein [Colwellia sp. MB3u-4]